MVLNRLTDSNWIFYGILALIFAGSLFFLLVPLAAVLVHGFSYIGASITSAEVRFSLLLSIRTTTEATIICMIAATASGYALKQLPPLPRKIFFSILSVPMSLPHLVSGVALLLVYGRLGIGGWLFRTTGIDFIYTKQGITLALVFVNLSYAVIMMYSAFDTNQEQMEFTARTLGCSKAGAFFNITLPVTLPSLLSTAVMTWSRALGEFGAVIMIAGSTRMKTETLPTAIYLNMATGDLDTALGISAMLILVSVLCIIILQVCIPPFRRKEAAPCSM
jgi:molybdate transport system permease protein